MHLNHLLGILKGGNKALERKLETLLAEDCNIVEYTDDAVLFTQGNKLVLAKVKNAVTESTFTPDNLQAPEFVYVSKGNVHTELQEHLTDIIACLAEEDFVGCREKLAAFNERFYQYGVLNNMYPNLFVESLARYSKGFPIRKQAVKAIPAFKGALYAAAALSESADVDLVSVLETVNHHGVVLALGKSKVRDIMLEAFRGNEELTNQYMTTIYEMVSDMPDANDDLNGALEDGYDLEAGAYPDESPSDLDNEDYTIDTDDELVDNPEGGDVDSTDEAPAFEPFDPAKLTPEEARELHVNTLKSILSTIHDFVVSKSNDVSDTTIDTDMDSKIADDLAKLDSPDLNDDELSAIESRWNPVVDYFLDSDVHQTEEDEFSLPAEAAEAPEETGDANTVAELGVGDDDVVAGEEVAEEPLPEEPVM